MSNIFFQNWISTQVFFHPERTHPKRTVIILLQFLVDPCIEKLLYKSSLACQRYRLVYLCKEKELSVELYRKQNGSCCKLDYNFLPGVHIYKTHTCQWKLNKFDKYVKLAGSANVSQCNKNRQRTHHLLIFPQALARNLIPVK